ncbi:acetyltransferase [Vibrio cholerae]|nr:acetyltransferase [Vibrio cholerae]
MVSAVVFDFGVMRCQPLRRALCVYSANTRILCLSGSIATNVMP